MYFLHYYTAGMYDRVWRRLLLAGVWGAGWRSWCSVSAAGGRATSCVNSRQELTWRAIHCVSRPFPHGGSLGASKSLTFVLSRSSE